jgi:hypothetical protein
LICVERDQRKPIFRKVMFRLKLPVPVFFAGPVRALQKAHRSARISTAPTLRARFFRQRSAPSGKDIFTALTGRRRALQESPREDDH